jgi:OmpA-OmpF porin, OOP family
MARLLSFLAFLILLVTIAEATQAQGILDRARRAAERGAERAVEREAEARADRAVTGAIECVVGDRACLERAKADGREVTYVDETGDAVPAERVAAMQQEAAAKEDVGAAAVPGEGVWVNYDFIPGDRPLFIEDFTSDRIGNFPRRLDFGSGNMEVALWRDRPYLRITSPAVFRVLLDENLPVRFTLEFEVHQPHASHSLIVATGEPRPPHMMGVYEGSAIHVNRIGTGVQAYRGVGGEGRREAPAVTEAVPQVRVMADGRYVKVYVDEDRVANVPNAELARSREISFIVGWAGPEAPLYMGPIRVAAGGASIYDALMEHGQVSTQGILFATGSAQIQPESTPTLKELARTLQQNGDLRLRIEGHTDSVGSAEANLRLSGQRAQAVVDYLVQRESIAPGRLEAAGLGQTQPAADNDTPEGRQANRRVELVVL